MSNKRKTCAFLSLYTMEGEPYKKHINQPTVPKVFMIKRHDGLIGFLGGKTDPGETIQQGLIREVKEESGYDISHLKLQQVSVVPHGDFDIYHFTSKVDMKTIYDLIRCLTSHPNFLKEVAGFSLDIIHPTTIDKLLGNNYCATANIELENLIKNHINPQLQYTNLNW